MSPRSHTRPASPPRPVVAAFPTPPFFPSFRPFQGYYTPATACLHEKNHVRVSNAVCLLVPKSTRAAISTRTLHTGPLGRVCPCNGVCPTFQLRCVDLRACSCLPVLGMNFVSLLMQIFLGFLPRVRGRVFGVTDWPATLHSWVSMRAVFVSLPAVTQSIL